jgi:hypothetical protein
MIKGKKIQSIPGEQIYQMVAPHTDTIGKVWPKGTGYRPLCGGTSNPTIARYQEVVIQGEKVRFEE